MTEFRANGKLLLTSEYVVLDGAEALAVPTRLGQKFSVYSLKSPKISWKSYDCEGLVWINEEFSMAEIQSFEGRVVENNPKTRLLQVLHQAHKLNPTFLNDRGYLVESSLEFPKEWGLGTSSTFISFVAQWFGIDAFELLQNTFGGSGYDLACATARQPILYQLENKLPTIREVSFQPKFSSHLYFVYLNRKQNSRNSIAAYQDVRGGLSQSQMDFFSALTRQLMQTDSLQTFSELLQAHEQELSKILKTPTIQEQLFSDFSGVVKSLGGWGGDFVWIICTENPTNYFRSKGYKVVIPYSEMVL